MPPRKKAATGQTPVEDLRHDDTRANIPTGELAGFVADEVARRCTSADGRGRAHPR